MNSHIWEKDDPRRFRCVRYLFWLACWTPIVMITLMTLYGYYAYVIVVCVQLVENDVQRIFYLLTVHILLLLYASTFFRAVFARQALVPQKYRYSHPGESEITLQHGLEEHARREQLILHQKTPTGDIRYCQKCELIKPDRAHHCSACNRCVLKMDHHCPWINNCCAYSNYKYFVLFVNYAFLICVFVALSAGPYCLLIFLQTPLNSNYQKYNVLVIVFLCIAFAFSTAMLGFFHIYLASRNSSTMESAHPPLVQGRRCKDAFHLGYRRNLELVFGANIFLGFIPIDNRPGNGYEFELAPSLDAEGNSLFIDSRNLPTNDSTENPSAPSANNIRSSLPDSAVRVENSADNDSESGEERRLLS